MNTPSKVLVVDDQPINVHMLKRKLEKHKMEVRTATSGAECLQMVEEDCPDLILLDVMMPEMDGFEVCRNLQKNRKTASIPIIFVTAKTSKGGRLEGLGVGAVDYITKPIDLDETLARVQTQLRFLEINRENIRLQQRLGEVRRNSAIGAITQGIAHNLNNLLGVAVGYLDLIRISNEKPDLVLKYHTMLDQAIQRIITIIRQLSSQIEENQLPRTEVPLGQLIEEGISVFKKEMGQELPVKLKIHRPEIALRTQREAIVESLNRLLRNAYESYAEETPGDQRTITLQTWEETNHGENTLVIRIRDEGSGIDKTVEDSIFDPFVSTKQTVGTGMGLTMARHALRNIGGDVTLKNNPDGQNGATALVFHPMELVSDRK
ncbi:MAG: hybrid sensor histidine kinase/response regulator [Opitutales bacterium]|nr:hybrid sensor histidine kinase/response regulator [Opitutales bacterium]MCH8540785.1 hybrid sensor histidine kinase/response regulator [Opitutales bacterium]